ncbi:hypothetical protein BDBG_08341 [Blastomyces gilchristii SLH14081]|uniref:Uncharacterized protein n=1 Tax=Blastomyces gilchristii (strain SLH14081) TaxID=559298 RepID=A0A179V0X2_BLAGS|nr:uncharacterized protein BDBG_08341 [Blastomyces gilchristii SLH14081]OAT13068.1 hypothetical protein BDBG_08341 [Blastomyces gilchristii SLH14081]
MKCSLLDCELWRIGALDAGPGTLLPPAMSMPLNHTIRLYPGPYRAGNDSLFSCHPSPFSSSAVELAFLHPSSHQIDFCWQEYLNNVDKIENVLNAPNSEEIPPKAKSGNTSLANRHYALVFTIYLSAILSMPHEDVESCYNAPKTEVLRTYRAVAELALARANFLRTGNILIPSRLSWYFCPLAYSWMKQSSRGH